MTVLCPLGTLIPPGYVKPTGNHGIERSPSSVRGYQTTNMLWYDVMVHLSRMRDKSRKVVQISELLTLTNGEYVLNKLYEFVEEGEDDKNLVMGVYNLLGT